MVSRSFTLQELESRVVALRLQAKQINAEADALQSAIETLRKHEKQQPLEEGDDTDFSALTVAGAIEKILRDAGKALHYTEILKRLNEKGKAATDAGVKYTLYHDDKGRFDKKGLGKFAARASG